MSVRAGLSRYYRIFGLRGVLAISAYRLFGQPEEITGRPAGIRNPVHIRLRTTDPSTYLAILVGREYAIDLPFSPKTILDAGANIGMASIYFTHRYPEAKIIAIEAEASNFEVLVRNVVPYPNIIPVHAALWNRDGEISVSNPDPATGVSGNWAFVTHEGDGGARVRAITMQTLMEEMRISAIDMAKIDIEGAEQEVFEDTRWLTGTRCLMIELHDRFRPGCTAAVAPAMREFVSTQRGETTFYVRRTLATEI
jgi:FkbM family methyltransferase